MDIKVIYELLKEVREDQKEHGQTLARHSVSLEHLEKDVGQMKEHTDENRKDLNYHIARTDELQNLNVNNKERIDATETRIAALEEPVKAKAWLKKHVVSILSVCTAIASLVALALKSFK